MGRLGAIRRTLLAYAAPSSGRYPRFGELTRSNHGPEGAVGLLFSVLLPPVEVVTSSLCGGHRHSLSRDHQLVEFDIVRSSSVPSDPGGQLPRGHDTH